MHSCRQLDYELGSEKRGCQMKTQPTIHAVAARAGVSTATVSKVVNGVETGISKATRLLVEAVVRDMGYRPNRIGRNLRTRRHGAVGLAIIDPSPRFLADPFTTNLVAGLSNQLNTDGFGLLLHGVRPGRLKDCSLVRNSEVDAICLNPSGDREERIRSMRLASGLGQPLIVIQDQPVADLPNACFVRQDDRGGAAALAELLMHRDPKRVAMIVADVAWPAVENRIAGFTQVFEREGVQLDLVACDETSNTAINDAITRYLDSHDAPDAIVGQNDQIAIAAIQVLTGRGLSVPDDIAVSGFNAFPFTGVAVPPLTTVCSRAYELGTTAARIIVERLGTGRFAETDYMLPLEVFEGRSI
jgi:LacI family transcriptional regulator